MPCRRWWSIIRGLKQLTTSLYALSPAAVFFPPHPRQLTELWRVCWIIAVLKPTSWDLQVGRSSYLSNSFNNTHLIFDLTEVRSALSHWNRCSFKSEFTQFTELHFALSVDLPGTFTMLIDNEWDFKCADISKKSSMTFFIDTFMEITSKSSSKEMSGIVSSTFHIPQPRRLWPWIISYYSSSINASWNLMELEVTLKLWITISSGTDCPQWDCICFLFSKLSMNDIRHHQENCP